MAKSIEEIEYELNEVSNIIIKVIGDPSRIIHARCLAWDMLNNGRMSIQRFKTLIDSKPERVKQLIEKLFNGSNNFLSFDPKAIGVNLAATCMSKVLQEFLDAKHDGVTTKNIKFDILPHNSEIVTIRVYDYDRYFDKMEVKDIIGFISKQQINQELYKEERKILVFINNKIPVYDISFTRPKSNEMFLKVLGI